MNIRQANENDYDKIYELVKVGFQTAQVTNGDEQNYVYELRAGENYIPKLELVIEEDDEIIGHIMLTKQCVNNTNKNVNSLLLGPICIKLEYRSKGYGGDLINKSFKIARDMGYDSVFLVGNPDYYNRFGFKQTDEFGIINDTEIPNKFVLGCQLNEGVFEDLEGSIKIV